MKNWGRIAALGMEPADFEELPDNGDMKSVFEKLALHEADMDDGQVNNIQVEDRTCNKGTYLHQWIVYVTYCRTFNLHSYIIYI